MKKTYITTMPNHIGAFLRASECFASLGVNITRVSYNKAVDSHTLFIDAEGSEEQLRAADDQLARIGYLQTPDNDKGIVLDLVFPVVGWPYRETTHRQLVVGINDDGVGRGSLGHGVSLVGGQCFDRCGLQVIATRIRRLSSDGGEACEQ